MSGTTVLPQSNHDPTGSNTLPSSPFPFSSFLSPSLFSLDVALPPPQPALPLPQQPPPHQAGLFVHSKEINPFERSFAVLDCASISTPPKPAVGSSNRRVNGTGGVDLYLPASTRQTRRKRALSSPALFTPGGTSIVDGSVAANELNLAKRPTLRLAVDGTGSLTSSVVGLQRGAVDSSLSLALSDSTGSCRSNTSNSLDDDLNYIPRDARDRTTTASPASSAGRSPEAPSKIAATRPRTAGYDSSFATSSSSIPPSFAHFQPQPIPFVLPSIAPNASSHVQPFLSSNFATTTLAPPSIPSVAPAPLDLDSSLDPSMSFTTLTEDSPYAFADPFALVPQHPPRQTAYPIPPPPPAMNHNIAPSNVPPPASYRTSPSNVPTPVFSIPQTESVNQSIRPPPQHNAVPPPPPQASTSKAPITASTSKPPPPAPMMSSGSFSTSNTTNTTTKPGGKKRGRKPKNWDPTLEMEVELDPVEQEKQRKLALERNRIAASKSRRRKKERVEALEGAARGFCEGNQNLQAQCQALLAEVHQLRAYLISAHPQPGCQCHHVHGYFNREREGGGIPAIMSESQGTLGRDYTKMPKWGSEDDLYVDVDLKKARQQHVAAQNAKTGCPYDGALIDGQPSGLSGFSVVDQGSMSKATGKSGKTKGKGSITNSKGGGTKRQHEAESEEEEDDDDEDEDGMSEEEESEEEKVALKSRRARAIPLRKTQ